MNDVSHEDHIYLAAYPLDVNRLHAGTRRILKTFMAAGLHIDASSGYEVRRAIKAGVPAERISLSTQELPEGAELAEVRNDVSQKDLVSYASQK